MEQLLNENWKGKLKYSEETCPIAILSIRNFTGPDLGMNPSYPSQISVSNCLKVDTSHLLVYIPGVL
jgi:hypothetical protein